MNPLGWMRAPEQSLAHWNELVALAEAAKSDGLDRTLVCGMGGSSLVADVLAETFRVQQLHVLDSTNPTSVRAAVADADLSRTLFVITSKSGSTIETLAFYHYFAARARPEQFVAITETDSSLATLARQRGFRAVIPHPKDVGGRYSALTAVGMLPAALGGIDGRVLLQRAQRVDVEAAQRLGRSIAGTAQAGRDKLGLAPPPPVAGLASWIEQLVAESSGKDGRGVIPIVQGGAALPDVQTLGASDFSADPLDLGLEFLRWEYATAALCEVLGVNAFDQPDVEEAKRLARAELAGPAAGGGGAKKTAALKTMTTAELRRSARPGDYFALLAYVPATAAVVAELQAIREAWGRAMGCVTTLGIGPRYLHSTGQLHKGGPPSGLFLVITTDNTTDIEIPELRTSFGALHLAQARGDVRALLARGRRVAHVHLSTARELAQIRP
jgi:D-arabinose 5-phosphate isomerase GutQ